MTTGETTQTAANPGGAYSVRLNALRLEQAAEQRQERLFGYAKLAVAFITIFLQ